jgi:putative transposase
LSTKQKITIIQKGHAELSLRQQCELLDLPRSSFYYTPEPVDPYNLMLMNLIDRQYSKTPFYGSPRITAWLKRHGHLVNIKRVKRLMQKMGIVAIYPAPNTSKGNQSHKIYPYLLRGVPIQKPNQVWGADITYIRMEKSFLYLVAIIDWFSRYVLAWELSNTLDSQFCIDALKDALAKYGVPEIFNTDQGCQFTSHDFTGILLDHEVNISMDGRGRVFDNIFVERLWRSVKYEEVYIKNYETSLDAYRGLSGYFNLYNNERLHQALDYRTPQETYYNKEVKTAKMLLPRHILN